MLLDFRVDDFQEKNKNRQAHAKTKDNECTRHVSQRQRFLMSIRLLMFHQALVNTRLNKNQVKLNFKSKEFNTLILVNQP